jgi:hypothetical protein
MTNTATGGCLCGAVTYSFDRDKVVSTHHCHCTDCQKSTGSGKATIVFVPSDAVDMKGDLKTYTVQGTAGSHVKRGFCGTCGSPLVSFIEENPGLTIIKAGSLDDSSWVQVASSFWSDSARSWSPVDPTCDSVPQNPAMG